MRLTVIGCAGSFPNADSPASCYLIEHDGFRVAVDMGNGSLGALLRVIDPLDLDAVLITHLHTDHCIDLCSLDVYLRFHPKRPAEKLPVYGPEGLSERIHAASAEGDHEVLDYIVLVPGTFQLGPFEVTAVRVAHPGTSYGYRISASGKSIAYSGDTGPTPVLAQLAERVDVALFEASFQVGDKIPPDLHMTGADAAAIAATAGAKRLILTHHSGWHERGYAIADAHGPVPVDSAYQGMVVDL